MRRDERSDSGYDSDSLLNRRRCPPASMTSVRRWKLASRYTPLAWVPRVQRPSFSRERVVASGILAAVPLLWWTRPGFVTQTVEDGLNFLKSEAVEKRVQSFHAFLERVGAPPPYPGANEVTLIIFVVMWSFIFYWLLFGKTHHDQRRELRSRLLDAKCEVERLTRQLEDETKSEEKKKKKNKPVRIFMEGAFDLMHYGHMNAFRLGHQLGTELVVGVNSDETIADCKGCAPCMSDSERQAAVAACRFVKEVVPNVPYVMTQEYLNGIIEKYNIDYVVHGDDPVIVNGKDVYAHVKAMGKYKSIPRTEGVSTTDIVGRMLLCTTRHHQRPERNDDGSFDGKSESGEDPLLFQSRSSTFYTTSSLLQQFSLNARPRKPGETVVYIDGAWDMFHAGHGLILERAKKLGDYLIVGVHNDIVVNKTRGKNFPIMNLNERVLSVLGCKHVADVLIDAPWDITDEMIQSLGITVVVRGTQSADTDADTDRYRVPIERGIFRKIDSPLDLSVDEILGRIQKNRDRYMVKFEKKKAKEDAYYDARYGRGDNTEGPSKSGECSKSSGLRRRR